MGVGAGASCDAPGAGSFDRVAEFALQRPSRDFPPSAMRAAATVLLDTLGVAIGSEPLDAGRIARDTAALLFAPGAEALSAPIMLDGRRASIAGAAFAVASQIDNFDAHDGYNPTKGHIGVVAAPSLFALAEARPDLSGPDALAALVTCYEIAGRAAVSLHATVSDYHTSGAWNALGVAAMAARLRGFDREQLRQALGVAEFHGPRSQMMREIANPTMLHDGSGWGALAGLSAAILAERGFEGAPAITVEAAEVAEHWADLGGFWQIEQQYIKPYPICRWAHAAIDAVRELRVEHGFDAADVKEVRIGAFHEAAQLYGGMPSTTSQAQYSLPFAVAAMLVHGEIGLAEITAEGLSDPEVAAMLPRIRVAEVERHSVRFPLARWADATIVLRDGRTVSSGDVHARGGPERPFTHDEVVEKFMAFSAPVIGADRARKVVDLTFGLQADDRRLSELATLINAPPPR